MIRPEIVQQLACPSFGLATSWIISRQGRPAETPEQVWREFRRETWPFPTTATGQVKDDGKARKLREQANEFYRKNPGETKKVLRMYNEGICWATEDSEETGMGFGNRSAIYYKSGDFRRCLANVEQAKAHGYPAEKMAKLEERKRKCLEALTSNSNGASAEQVDENETRYDLEIIESKEYGRSLTSKKDLNVGEIALAETFPSLVVVEPEEIYNRCSQCGNSNGLDLIACRSCVSVMYCSELCRDEAYKRYHKFECLIGEDLEKLFRGPKPTRMFQLTLRLFWMVIDDLVKNIHGFLESYQKGLKSYRNPLELDLTNQLHLHVLANSEPETESDPTGRGVTQFLTALIFKVAVEENPAVPNEPLMDNAKVLVEILYKLTLLAKGICDQSVNGLTCYYPLLQMVNHSCAPNAERIMVQDQRSILLVKRPIKAGEHILICYFPNGSTDYKNRSQRREMLQKEFQLDCKCLGCTLDYPLLSAIEENADLRTRLEDIKSKPKDEQMKLLEDFLQQSDDQFPQKELAEAWNLYIQERMKHL
ncbi:uncharacterized protein LOC134223985 [Armigeres subalbatus]|uniref:uncharacterized protein LOC134223985 n=1 Tax=Armigeres subalbatus TaxID=124917 RepID=UPI002ED152A9